MHYLSRPRVKKQAHNPLEVQEELFIKTPLVPSLLRRCSATRPGMFLSKLVQDSQILVNFHPSEAWSKEIARLLSTKILVRYFHEFIPKYSQNQEIVLPST